MSNSKPEFIDPYKMAKAKHSLEGSLPLAAMPRANKMLESVDGHIDYRLMFDVDEDNVCFIEGEIHAVVALRCQRCLQVFSNEVNGNFMLSPVKDDFAAKALNASYEPVIVNDAKLYLAELVEDELILAIPLSPMHYNQCVDFTDINGQGLDNPFRILQQMNVHNKGQKAEDK